MPLSAPVCRAGGGSRPGRNGVSGFAMKIVFIQLDPIIRAGIVSLSACVKKAGHQADLLIVSEEKNLIEKLKSMSPDLVGFPLVSGMHEQTMAIAEKIKSETHALTIFGGPHATFYPEEIIRHEAADIVCLGEGEEALVELLDSMSRGKNYLDTRNMWFKNGGKIVRNALRPFNEDLDALPLQDRSIYYKYELLRRQPSKDFVFTRGCPYRCSFCFNSHFRELYGGQGKFVRRPGVGRVIDEIVAVRDNYGLESVMIMDDLFIADAEWLGRFVREYKKRVNLPFQCEVRADLVTENIIGELKEAGCTAVAVGVESGVERIRNEVLKKNLGDEKIISACKAITKAGILLKTYNMVAIPGETLADAFKTVEFNIRLNTDYAWCSVLRIYPGTPLAHEAVRMGLLDENFSLKDFGNSYLLSGTPLKLKNKREILNLQRFFPLAVKFPALFPLIKRLIKLPPNRVFDIIFQATYAFLTISTTKIGLKNFFTLGLKTKNALKT